jgi:hypothetical protein
MKKTFVMLGLLAAMFVAGQASFAACPCQQETAAPACPCQAAPKTEPIETSCPSCPDNSCAKADCPCQTCAESWLEPQKVEDYFCRIGLSDCQKDSARKLIEEFKCNTKGLNGGECESKCDCRKYRKELRHLDYDMQKLLTQCQKSNYANVKSDIKSQVKCCHKCLIWPSMAPKCSKCN